MKTAYMFLALLVFIMYGATLWVSSIENFENEEGITFEDVKDIYDDVYASVYKLLWHSKEALDYERGSMLELALDNWPKQSVRVLDMCCGVAPHACWFNQQLQVDYVGVDKSDDMLARARKDCPSATFQNGDVTQVHLFSQKSMSHCLLLNFSIYQFENPKILSDNAYQWLQPDGMFVVHLVDPDKYDPLLDLASPFAAFSLQKYNAGDRQTNSYIYFDKFKYSGKLIKKKDEDKAEYNEVFTYYDKEDNHGKKYRENKHHWNMPSKERLIDIFKTSGFRHLENVDLVHTGKEYQYLCYFQK